MQTPREGSNGEPAGQMQETQARDQLDQADESLYIRVDESDVSSRPEELADLYARRGRYDLAVACAQRAVAHDPEDPRLLRLLGRMLEAGGETDLARDAYLAAVAVGANPRHPQPWLGLARLERTRGRLAAAEQYAQRALDVAPHLAEVYAELARILLRDGRAARALDVLARGLQCVPGDRELIDLRNAALTAAASGSKDQEDQTGM